MNNDNPMTKRGDVIVLSGTPEEETLLRVGPRVFIPVVEPEFTPLYSAAGTDPEKEELRKAELKDELYWFRMEQRGWQTRESIRNELAHKRGMKK